MFNLILLMKLFGVIPLIASGQQTKLLIANFVSDLSHGFKDYPFVLWTSGMELFPHLAEVLMMESQKQVRPLELWQHSHALCRPHLKFARGKSVYFIFPPTHVGDTNNVMLKMLQNFTTCNKVSDSDDVVIEQMKKSIFLFLSTTHDGSQEDLWFMQKKQRDYCNTPSQILFLKYSFQDHRKTLIQLESLRAVRMRCHQTYRYACVELVHENNSLQVLSQLCSEKIRSLIQVQWRKTYSAHVFIGGLSRYQVLEPYGADWESLKAVFINSPIRVRTGLNYGLTGNIPFFELISNVNISVTAIVSEDTSYFEQTVVGTIYTHYLTNSYKSGISLRDSIHFVMMYGADFTSTSNPFTSTSLFGACGTLHLLIILGFVCLISVLRMKKYRLKDFTKLIISMVASLFSQSCPYQRSRQKLLYYIWMTSVWFSTGMFLSLLQSQRIAPSLQQANETFKDLERRQMSFFASYGTYQYVHGNFGYQSPPFKRLGTIVQEMPIWDVPDDEFRNFFTLNRSAYVVNAVDVEPIGRVLTEAYSKHYNVLPEKIFPQLEWSLISIPQGEYVIKSFKMVKQSGLWDYWYSASIVKRAARVEDDFRDTLLENSALLEISDAFVSLNIADSVLLEMTTLCGLIIGALITFRILQTMWVRRKGIMSWFKILLSIRISITLRLKSAYPMNQN